MNNVDKTTFIISLIPTSSSKISRKKARIVADVDVDASYFIETIHASPDMVQKMSPYLLNQYNHPLLELHKEPFFVGPNQSHDPSLSRMYGNG
jgi:hypothetical protein